MIAFALADTGAEPRPIEQTLALFGVSAATLAAFIWRELHSREPLIDMRMFRDHRLAISFAIFFLQGGALITALVDVPLGAEVLWGRTGAGPGLVLMRMVAFMIAGGLGAYRASGPGGRVQCLRPETRCLLALFCASDWH